MASSSSSNRMSRRFYPRMDSINFADSSYFDHGLSAEVENKWVFEVAWEVVNKGQCSLFCLMFSIY